MGAVQASGGRGAAVSSAPRLPQACRRRLGRPVAWRSVHEQDAHWGAGGHHRAGRPRSAGAGVDVERDDGVTVAVGGYAVLLANHGPVVAGATLEQATDAIEELEAT
ncbi:class II aldolase/adducin family protein, partial [Streptomyces caniscabiei]|uniref:class II aldolase/adducin family protein n=1 Tax=Streptomyces caniscabiei TaxID=2746961 RepID=UPI0030B99839